MSKHLPHLIKRGIRAFLLQPGRLLECMCTVSGQINLLSILMTGCITVGFLANFFASQSFTDKTIAACSLAGFCVVVLLNTWRKDQHATILFYIALNMITLITFRALPGQPVEAILMYVLLLSLIVFLFQKTITRVICLSIVLLRIIFFEINVSYISHAEGIVPSTTGEQARLGFDGIVLALIVLVFFLYGLKIYTIETLQKRNTLFAQHMSHDLQVSYHSVASIISYLKYSGDNNRIASNDKILINTLANASGFFSYVLNNFLEFSRFERGRIEANHYEAMDLESELERIVGLHQYITEEKGVRIALVLDDEFPGIIQADKIKVTRIVLNLLTNAINHTDRGKTITITVRWKNGPWELSVANEGKILLSEDIQQLFTTYESRETSNGKSRLGLGLPITKELAEALGGSIKATNLEDREVLFTVAFPVG